MCTPAALSILYISVSSTLSVGQPVNGMGVSPRMASWLAMVWTTRYLVSTLRQLIS